MEADQSLKRKLLSEEFLTSDEAAVALGLKSRRALEYWRKHNLHPELEVVRVGRLVKYRATSILKFLNACTSGASMA